jgi:hypothetical protein
VGWCSYDASTVVYFESGGGWISLAIPRKCSPLAQIRREQKKPGPLLLVYFMSTVLSVHIIVNSHFQNHRQLSEQLLESQAGTSFLKRVSGRIFRTSNVSDFKPRSK